MELFWIVLLLPLFVVFSIFAFMFCCCCVCDTRPFRVPFHVKVISFFFRLAFIDLFPLEMFQYFANKEEKTEMPNVVIEKTILNAEPKEGSGEKKSLLKKIEIYTFSEKVSQLERSKSENPEKNVVITYFHGGGYVFGHATQRKTLFKCFFESAKKNKMNLVIIAPNYEKAPKVTVDEIFDESYQALMNSFSSFPSSIHVISGDSAGGMIALFLAQKMRDLEYAGVGVSRSKILVCPLYCGVLSPEIKTHQKIIEKKSLDSHRKYGSKGLITNRTVLKLISSLDHNINPTESQKKKSNYNLLKNTDRLPSHSLFPCQYDYLCSEMDLLSDAINNSFEAEKKKNMTLTDPIAIAENEKKKFFCNIHLIQNDVHSLFLHKENSEAFIAEKLFEDIHNLKF